MNDTERLNWLEEQGCYSLISDDGVHWACIVDGIQNVPLEDGPADISTVFFVDKEDWKGSIREAIDMAMQV